MMGLLNAITMTIIERPPESVSFALSAPGAC
jgi:hypothetical protein